MIALSDSADATSFALAGSGFNDRCKQTGEGTDDEERARGRRGGLPEVGGRAGAGGLTTWQTHNQ